VPVSKPKGLGRGFDALIPKNFDSSLLLDKDERVHKLLITDIVPHKDQPRKEFDQTAIEELAGSIKRHGILQPVVVTPTDNGKYHIVAGERRWRAAQLAGHTSIPAIVRSLQELERLEIALVENVQRVDLSPLEQAASIQRLHDQFSIEIESIAQRLGKATTTVQNLVRLLELPEDARSALQQGKITEGHARSILALKDKPAQQAELLKLILERGWNVRQAEQFVVACKQGKKGASAQAKTMTSTPQTEILSTVIKAPVSIKRTARGGKLEIAFKTDKELDRLVTLLTKRLGKRK
jgi:ParB family chromosome partitioning protein